MSLSSIISSGRIVDIMVFFVVIEVALLIYYRRRTGKGIPIVPLIVNVGAGGSLMLALGATLKGYGTTVIAVCLISSLVFHVTDLLLRWNR